jgi:hypothetical protein
MKIPENEFWDLPVIEFVKMRTAYVAQRRLGVFGVPANDTRKE